MILYTVEYEKLRTGLDGAGNTSQLWFPVVETFRPGRIDKPAERARARVNVIATDPLCRDVKLVSWHQGSIKVPPL